MPPLWRRKTFLIRRGTDPLPHGKEKVVGRTWLASFALLLTFGIVAHAWGDTLADEMAALNARWDAAINDPNPDALLPMYTADARLMPPGAQPVIGPTAIRNFFAARGTSTRNHKLQLVDIQPIGTYVYVTSHFTASFVKGGETTSISGSTVRMYEHQSDGQWKISSHMFVRE
jgi:uncharacterized protein (TIGR02246 family)